MGNILTDCSAIDSLHCWACGWFGTIIHTSNGGENWNILQAGKNNTDEMFNEIKFLDYNRGFVLARNSALLKTLDGGKSWENVEINTEAEYYYDFKFIKNKYGWLSTNRGEIFYTDDSGDTWRLISTIKQQKILSLFFHDRLNGWAGTFEGGLFKTTDGGKTWSTNKVKDVSYIRFINFINKKTGFITCDDATDTDFGFLVYYTTDGGENWSKLNEHISWIDLFHINDEKIFTVGGDLQLFNLNDFSITGIFEYTNIYSLGAIDFPDPLH